MYYLRNISTLPVNLSDLGTSIPVGADVPIANFDHVDLMKSTDTIAAIINGTLSVYDDVSKIDLPEDVAIRIVVSAGTLPLQTPSGMLRVIASPRPIGHWTYFTGAGDKDNGDGTWEIGEGSQLSFSLRSTDASKSVDIVFSEDVELKDGFIICDSAPFGSCLSFDVVHPVYGLVNRFANKVPLLRSGWFPLDAADSGLVPQGLLLRATVFNSDDANAMHDSPAAFRVSCRLELYRKKTVSTAAAATTKF